MSEWQPIETAPKDLSDILVFCQAGGVDFVHIAYWDADEDDQWKSGGFASKEELVGWWSYVENCVGQVKLDGYKLPLYWMPLPLPPVKEL